MQDDLDRVKHGTTIAPVNDLFLRRWSPRAFADKPVSDEELRSVFSAGQWAASSNNEQPWRFVVGHKGDPTWAKIFDALVPGNQSWAQHAPVLYASFAKKTFSRGGAPNRVAQHDVGAASAELALQAASMGLYAHGMGGFDPDKLRANFAVPDDFEPMACWALGHRGDPEMLNEHQRQMEVSPRQRKPLGEWVFAEWEKAAL